MSELTFNSRPPNFPIPTTIRSIGFPSGSQGTPWRAASSRVWARTIASTETSAKSLITRTTSS